jgi:hypothetical protein
MLGMRGGGIVQALELSGAMAGMSICSCGDGTRQLEVASYSPSMPYEKHDFIGPTPMPLFALQIEIHLKIF